MVRQPSTWMFLLFAGLSGGVLALIPPGLLARQGADFSLDGKQVNGYTIFKKVVVVRPEAKFYTTLDKYKQKRAESKYVPLFSVFYKLKANNPRETPPAGLVAVGTFDARLLGYIEEDYLELWDTRYVLKPTEPKPPHVVFSFIPIVNGKEQAPVQLLGLPSGGVHRCYSFVKSILSTGKQEDANVYEVFVSTGVQQDTRGNVEMPEPEETKLEIVFVLESSDFMNKKYGDDPKRLLDHLQDLVKTVATEITRDPELKKSVRLGFVQYWDNVAIKPGDRRFEKQEPEAAKKLEAAIRAVQDKFPAHMTCDLQDDPEKVVAEVMKLTATDLWDDWSDDVLAGLDLAVNKTTWSHRRSGSTGKMNSFKHVILIGSAAAHLAPAGELVSQDHAGKENAYTRSSNRTTPRGFNSTKLSIKELLDRAQPTAAGKSIHLGRIYLSTLFMPNEKPNLTKDCPKLDASRLARCRQLMREVVEEQDSDKLKETLGRLRKELATATSGEEEASKYEGALFRAHRIEYQANLAKSHYLELSKGLAGGEGLFREVEPTPADVQKASKELADKILEMYKRIKELHRVRPKSVATEPPKDNPLALPIWRLTEEIRSNFKVPIVSGKARVRNDRGDQIAERRILIARPEMIRLEGVLRDLHERFKLLGADRKNPDEILRELQESLGKAGLGQLDTKNKETLTKTTLEAMLNNLPMRSPALKVTPQEIKDMDDKGYDNWVKQIQIASKRCLENLKDESAWQLLSEGTVPGDDKYGFFLLSSMP